jgi:uncharacterized membrane protein YbjE (DUF340 family)
VPETGDIVWLNFTPQAGREQAGHRSALLLSPAARCCWCLWGCSPAVRILLKLSNLSPIDKAVASCLSARLNWHWTSGTIHHSLSGIFLSALVLGSLGTFLLYIPVFPFAVVMTVLLCLMFVLGVQTGGRRIQILRRKNLSQPPELTSLNRAS